MRIHANYNLLVVLLLVTASLDPTICQRRTTPKKRTNTTTESNYFFEGVDYELAPMNIQLEHNDCYGEHHRCIRMRTYFTPVCGYDIRNYHYEDFYSPCELDLYSCKYRVQRGYGVHGTNYTNDVIFYNGEELNCLYYYRRVRNSEEMDALYFGSKNPPFRSLPTPEKYLRNSTNGLP